MKDVDRMAKRVILILGWLWPFGVAAGGTASLFAGWELYGDDVMLRLFFAALLGFPAVIVTLIGLFPEGWPDGLRYLLGLTISVPVLGIELLLAAWALGLGAREAGGGWIE